MKKYIQNSRGMTLVEVLASLTIATVLIIFIVSAHLFVTNQYRHQSDSLQTKNDITYLLKQITNDFRRADQTSITVETDTSIVLGDDHYVWKESEKTLLKNGNQILDQITYFTIEEQDGLITISVQYKDEEVRQLTLTRRGEESID